MAFSRQTHTATCPTRGDLRSDRVRGAQHVEWGIRQNGREGRQGLTAVCVHVHVRVGLGGS